MDYPEHDIHIHFDKKRYSEEVEQITAIHSNLTIISEISVHWGSYSVVECEFLLMKLAIQTPHSYYHVLSGVDLPLKRAGEMYALFEGSCKQFVHYDGPEFEKRYGDWVYYKHISAEIFRTGRNGLEKRVV